MYWIIGFPFAVIGVLFSVVGFIFSTSGVSPSSDGMGSRRLSSTKYKNESTRETVEIQYQQISGNWRTTNVTANNLDQTIANALINVERTTARMSGTTGRLRAKGKNSGSIYDTRN